MDGARPAARGELACAAGLNLVADGMPAATSTGVSGPLEVVRAHTAVSQAGIATGLAESADLRSARRRGIIFAPPNRNVTIFPERMGGLYHALHRPMPEGIGQPSIWAASSPDLVHWGAHRLVAAPRPGRWDDVKVGGGAVPFRLPAGVPGPAGAWLAIYHGVTGSPHRYALGALLLDPEQPWRVLGRSRSPVLAPEAPYERHGFFGDVVFTCGALLRGDLVWIYYGAADGVTALAQVPLEAILADLE